MILASIKSFTMIALVLFGMDQVVDPKTSDSTLTLIGPILNVGAVGACLILLAVYYVKKDKKYEARIDEMREMEKAFRREMTDLQEKFRKEQADRDEKYRLALEKFGQIMDSFITMLKSKKSQ